MPRGTNAPKLWPAEPVNSMSDRVVRQPLAAVPLRHLVAEHRADRAVDVADRAGRATPACRARARRCDAAMSSLSSACVEAVILRLHPPARRAGRRRPARGGSAEKSRPLRLPVIDRLPEVQPVHAADHLVHRAEAERRHVLAHFLGDEPEEVDDELGLAGELLPQLRILRRDADRAGVQVADAHHDAARDDERRRREAELLGAHQRGDRRRRGRSSAGRPPARRCGRAGLFIISTCCVSARPELPRHAAVLDRGERRGARAAVVARDEHDVGVRLRDAGRDRADAGERDELHVNARLGFAFFRSWMSCARSSIE